MTTPTFSRQALEDVASFLPIFGATGFDFGTWVLRQGSFPFVTYHPEVGRFVRTLERHGWVYESSDFLWGPWLRTPEAAGLLSGETLPRATPEQLARLLTVFARQERIVDGSRLDMYQSGLLLAALRRTQSWLELPPGEVDAPDDPQSHTPQSHTPQSHTSVAPGVRQDWTLPGSSLGPQAAPLRQSRPFGEPARPRPAPFPSPHPSSSLTFSEAAQRVHAFISQFEEGYFPPLLMLARLTEETGEIARVLAHQNGKKPKPGEDVGDLELELADLLFVAICLANERGLSLERGFARMMDKIERRDKDRWTRKVDLSWTAPEPEAKSAEHEGSVHPHEAYALPESDQPPALAAAEPGPEHGRGEAERAKGEQETVTLDLPLGAALVVSARAGKGQAPQSQEQSQEQPHENDGPTPPAEHTSLTAQAPAPDLPATDISVTDLPTTDLPLTDLPPTNLPEDARPDEIIPAELTTAELTTAQPTLLAPLDGVTQTAETAPTVTAPTVTAQTVTAPTVTGETAQAPQAAQSARGKARGGEIAKPVKALARKRTPRK